MDTVTVSTGSRLHFGPFSWRSAGPAFGGVGLMIDEPRTALTATRSSEFSATGEADAVAKLEGLFDRMTAKSDVRAAFCVEAWADAHHGFGSGTQLACAAAAALMRLADQTIEVGPLAALSGRGERSAIGLHGFLRGGFLVDAGRGAKSVGTLATRVAFPESWVILLDRGGGVGMAGQPEAEAFRDLPPMPAEMTGRLCDLTLRFLLPSLIDEDFATFANALTAFGRTAGRFFQAVQGGEFADASWFDRVDEIQALVPAAVAQSSWGPTVAVIVENEADAARVEAALSDRTFERVRPRNEPALIT